jgi:glycerol-3-phosphate dehydrogenase
VLAAEIVHAAGHEMALTLSDALFRRTDLCTLGHPGEPALRAAARVMGECMGWDQGRLDAELDYVRDRLRLSSTGRALLAEPAIRHAYVA